MMYLFLFTVLININILIFLLYKSPLLKRYLIFSRFVEMYTIYERTKFTTFEKVWREDLHVYLINNRSITKSVLEEALRKYVSLFCETIGPSVLDDLTTLYGSDESIVIHIGDEFVNMVIDKENSIKPTITKGQNNETTIAGV